MKIPRLSDDELLDDFDIELPRCEVLYASSRSGATGPPNSTYL